MIGDLNARVGDIIYDKPYVTYAKNPDCTVNSNGRKILKWIDQANDMLLVNGYVGYNGKKFDTDFTFYRGKVKSQNDLAFTNDIESIKSFNILQKLIQSDHCPISLNMEVELATPLEIVHDCAF